MKITTADCKQFLAGFFGENENYKMMMANGGWDDPEFEQQLIKDMLDPKAWIRDKKRKPWRDEYPVFVNNRYANMDKARIKCERTFMLRPDVYDTQVMYLVIEDDAGRLHLGEYVGD